MIGEKADVDNKIYIYQVTAIAISSKNHASFNCQS